MSSDEGVDGDAEMATPSILAPFTRDVLLSSGRAVHVRPVEAADLDSVRRFYERLGEEARYSRFFGLRPSIPDDELREATVQDVRRQVTLMAESDGAMIGIGEYRSMPGGEEVEVAFAVADDHHHEGIATVLLEDLALIARAAGFRRLVAETLPGNMAMQGVFRTVGLVHRSWFEEGVVCVQLDLTADTLLQDDADLRDWKAAVRSLRPLVEPSHVVVVGAGDDEHTPGGRLLVDLRRTFSGRVSVVEGASAPLGVPDGVPDLAVIAVPARSVGEAVDRCGAAGVRTAVIVSAGFAELGAEGTRLEDELLATARRHGMRVVGPNSLGVVSTSCGLAATVTGRTFRLGGIAIASQSGGVGIAVAAEADRRRAGLSSFVSMGDKVDVSGNDLLRLWADDETTRVVLLHLESFGDPVRFARVAHAVSRRKPVVALKSGGSPREQALVGALFDHTGVLRARTLEELVDVGLLLDRQAAPRGRRIALIGNAGGPLTLGADAARGRRLDVVELSPDVQAQLADLAPGAVSTANPVDLGAAATPERLAAVAGALAGSGEIDCCIVVHVRLDPGHRLDETARLVAEVDLGKMAVAVSLIGGDEPGSLPLPVYRTPERAVAAMALAVRRGQWLASTASPGDEATGVDASAFAEVRRVVQEHASAGGPVVLDVDATLAVLGAAGVPVAGEHERPVELALFVGVERDPAFGPVLVVGDGGPDAELRDDRATLIAPASRPAIRRAVEGLRLAPLLHGYRGRPELPVEQLVELVHRVGVLAATTPEVQELHLDPLLVGPEGCLAADARITVAAPPSPVLPVRRLRERRAAPPRG